MSHSMRFNTVFTGNNFTLDIFKFQLSVRKSQWNVYSYDFSEWVNNHILPQSILSVNKKKVVEMLLSHNPKAKSFIADTFHGYYYTKPILEFLDNTYANIQRLSGYKKDLALAALGHTCKAKGHGPKGHGPKGHGPKGNDHVVDAGGCCLLVREQLREGGNWDKPTVDFVMPLVTDPLPWWG